MPLMALNKITKTFHSGKRNEVQALRGVDLTIEAGQSVAICGVSGCGKSTLLHILGCLDRADSGIYSFDNLPIEDMSDAKLAALRSNRIALIPQNHGLVLQAKVWENVAVPLLFSKKIDREIKRACELALDQVGLRKLIQEKTMSLSGGERQRVAIARALVYQPDVILADEPSSALDVETTKDLMAMLTALSDQGKTMVAVTHDPIVRDACQFVYKMRDGKVYDDIRDTVSATG